jgi:hypothetical protein
LSKIALRWPRTVVSLMPSLAATAADSVGRDGVAVDGNPRIRGSDAERHQIATVPHGDLDLGPAYGRATLDARPRVGCAAIPAPIRWPG